MTIEYDEKGKFYTNVVHKVAVPSIMQTTMHLIKGLVHVRQGERLKDELENHEEYMAVTNANVFDAKGDVVYSSLFLAVQKKQIVWIMPVDDEENKAGNG
ncbi:MAG TPA: hypothetical protein PKL78_04715 [Anaerolineales bacterium]|nr:hypothetical protein [Anaerolineales bacterium]HNN12835.1 hypothetical protein [Anaerolineales bacterium]